MWPWFIFLRTTKQDGGEDGSEDMHGQHLEVSRGSPFVHSFLVKLFDEWENLTDGCSVPFFACLACLPGLTVFFLPVFFLLLVVLDGWPPAHLSPHGDEDEDEDEKYYYNIFSL